MMRVIGETDNRESIFLKLVSYFNDSNVCYAILGNTANLPSLDTDLDICVRDVHSFTKKLADFCKKNNIELIGSEYHATGIRYNIVSISTSDDPIFFPGPDVLIFPTWKIRGDIGLSYTTLLQSRVWDDRGFFVPSSHNDFIFYLVKRIDKGDLTQKQGEYLSSIWVKDSSSIEETLLRFWSADTVNIIVKAANTDNWSKVITMANDLRLELSKQSAFYSGRLKWILARILKRLIYPSGYIVVFLGPDGSGKSSVIERVIPDLALAFRKTRYMHLRPRLGLSTDENSPPVVDPHGQPPRGWLSSVVKVFYFFFDYTFGYLLKVRPLLVRSTFVVFDRYYHDMLVDPRRYRYGGPMWLARWVGKIIPKPDIVILLDAPAEVLQARKQEVPFEETARQRQAYLKLVQGLKNGVVVDASQPLDKVVADVNKVVLNYMATKTQKRLGY